MRGVGQREQRSEGGGGAGWERSEGGGGAGWERSEGGGGAGWERDVEATARALVYLFTPEIDLLENASSSLQHYDKYWKTKTILWELVRAMRNSELAGEVTRTAEEVAYLEAQVEELQAGLEEWQLQSEAQQQTIQEDQQRLLLLTAAYQEAKMLFQEELRERKCEVQELTKLLARQSGQAKEGREGRDKQGKVGKGQKEELCVRINQQSRVYTDRSIYQRFSVSNQESCIVVNSLQADTLSAYLPPEIYSQQQLPSAKDIEKIKQEVDNQKSQVERLRGELQKMKDLKDQLERDSQILQAELVRVKQRLLEQEADKTKLRTQLSDKNRKIEELLQLMGV